MRPKAVKYEEYTVSREDIREELTVSGEIRAEKQADLRFQTGGRLAWVGVKQGDWVKKWQGIAGLDRRSIEKNLQKELNDYMNERWNFEGDRET
jgi:macrolide-specific efflux system membrane fusion protein